MAEPLAPGRRFRGEIDVAVIEIERSALPKTAYYRHSPENS